MATENQAVVPVDLDNLPVSQYADDKAFDAVSAAGAWLPRIQIMTGNSRIVQEGKIGVGRLALIKSNNSHVDLSAECSMFVLSWRPKALKIVGDDVTSVYDPNNAEFADIVSQSEVQDSGCMYGPEFLVWLPNPGCFATFHFASKTARREAPNLRQYMKKWATVRTQVIKKGQYTWHGPVVTVCNQTYDLPSGDQIHAEVTKFVNPPVSEVEAAPADSVRER